MEEAIRIDAAAWARFSLSRKDHKIFKIPQMAEFGPKQALAEAYAFVNKQEIIDIDENRIVFRMNDCRVQSARKRKNMPDFLQTVGLVEYESFARPSIPDQNPLHRLPPG